MFKTFIYPIRSRLILALLMPLLPLVIVMMYMSWEGNKEQIERANETTKDYALIVAGGQKEILSDMRQFLSILVEEPQYRNGGDTCSRGLNRIAARINIYSEIAVTNSSGVIICGTGNSTGASIADKNYFNQTLKSLQFTISETDTGHNSNSAVIVGAMPWVDQNGDLGGMVIASIDVSRFSESFEKMPLPPGSRYYLLDRRSNLVSGSDPFPDILRARLSELPVLTETPTPFVVRQPDMTRTYTGVTVENGALTILIGIPRKFFLNTSVGNMLVSLLGPIAILFAVITLIWFAGNRLVTAPVTALIRTARAYSGGDLSVRPPADASGGELKELSITFSHMADRIAKRENELQDAIQRRDLMLREIHHRVKNNLQIVISLVNLQSKSVSLPAAQNAFTEIQTRMRALALVHRYLYESEDLQSVNIGSFLTELCSSLQTAYNVSPTRVAMDVKADSVFEIIDRAVPLALFMTEVISNALRHAFPENRPGYIHITLKALEKDRACFCTEDNGIGLNVDNNDSSSSGTQPATGLGMSLAKAFARQVDGDLTVSGVQGTIVTLIFKTKAIPNVALSAI